MKTEDMLGKITELLIDGNKNEIERLISELLKQNVSPIDIIEKGLTPGMQAVGDKFENMELFLPEMMFAAEIMKAAVNQLQPFVGEKKSIEKRGNVLIGTIQGDVHDIGKNIVSTLLEVSGFEVNDLGRNVPAKEFVKRAQEVKADIIAISVLMTTTMNDVPEVIVELKRRGLREQFPVIVGGAPVTEKWVRDIGADGTAVDAVGAVKLAEELIKAKK